MVDMDMVMDMSPIPVSHIQVADLFSIVSFPKERTLQSNASLEVSLEEQQCFLSGRVLFVCCLQENGRVLLQLMNNLIRLPWFRQCTGKQDKDEEKDKNCFNQ